MNVKVGDLVRRADDRAYWKKRGIRPLFTELDIRLGIIIKIHSWGCYVMWNDGEKLTYKPEQLEVVR